MFAIIESGGKQYTIEIGSTILLEKIEGKEGAKVKFDNIPYIYVAVAVEKLIYNGV